MKKNGRDNRGRRERISKQHSDGTSIRKAKKSTKE
jgi:hypothetical protein